jgi:hypothetical protein
MSASAGSFASKESHCRRFHQEPSFMKLLVLFAALAVFVAAIPVPETSTFGQFKARYGKNYIGAEEQLREAIFNANLAKIAALNQQDPSAT